MTIARIRNLKLDLFKVVSENNELKRMIGEAYHQRWLNHMTDLERELINAMAAKGEVVIRNGHVFYTV